MLKKFILYILKFYIKIVSPQFPPRCKYYPTCSCYMLEAVKCFGVFKGVCLGVFRLLRCNFFAKGGFDPVIVKVRNYHKKEV